MKLVQIIASHVACSDRFLALENLLECLRLLRPTSGGVEMITVFLFSADCEDRLEMLRALPQVRNVYYLFDKDPLLKTRQMRKIDDFFRSLRRVWGEPLPNRPGPTPLKGVKVILTPMDGPEYDLAGLPDLKISDVYMSADDDDMQHPQRPEYLARIIAENMDLSSWRQNDRCVELWSRMALGSRWLTVLNLHAGELDNPTSDLSVAENFRGGYQAPKSLVGIETCYNYRYVNGTKKDWKTPQVQQEPYETSMDAENDKENEGTKSKGTESKGTESKEDEDNGTESKGTEIKGTENEEAEEDRSGKLIELGDLACVLSPLLSPALVIPSIMYQYRYGSFMGRMVLAFNCFSLLTFPLTLSANPFL